MFAVWYLTGMEFAYEAEGRNSAMFSKLNLQVAQDSAKPNTVSQDVGCMVQQPCKEDE